MNRTTGPRASKPAGIRASAATNSGSSLKVRFCVFPSRPDSSVWQEAQPTEEFLRSPPLTPVTDNVAILPCLPGLSLRSSTVGKSLPYLSQASYLKHLHLSVWEQWLGHQVGQAKRARWLIWPGVTFSQREMGTGVWIPYFSILQGGQSWVLFYRRP